jgi:cytochrome P450
VIDDQAPATPFTIDPLDPFGHFARLRESPPIEVPDHMGGRFWVVARYDDVRQVLSDDRRFTTDADIHLEVMRRSGHTGPLPDWLVETDDPATSASRDMLAHGGQEHTRLRRIVSKAFSPRRIEQMRPRALEIADEVLDSIDPAGETDLVYDFAFPFALRVVSHLVGIPFEEAHSQSLPAWSTKETQVIRRYLLNKIRQVRPGVRLDLPEEEQPNFLSALIAARDDDGTQLTEREVLDMIEIVWVAEPGPTTLIANSILALLRFPDQLRLLRERPELLSEAVEECLRFDGPAEDARHRLAIEDVDVGGITIPKWSKVIVLVTSANRDDRHFPDPDHLDITRARNDHITFGRGMHVCLGAPLVRLELGVALSSLIERFPDLELACAPEQIRWESHNSMNDFWGMVRLPVRLLGSGPAEEAVGNRSAGEA